MQLSTNQANQRRAQRVRSKITGTAERPRLVARISNLHATAQLVDDVAGKTLASVTSAGQKEAGANLSAKAAWVGTQIATAGKENKIKSVVFDRGGRLYHGRLKQLAEAARKAGLEF